MEIILEAGRTEKNYWKDLWRFRELFLVLAWRDLSVRYKQTVIGVAWALIRPLLTMLIFTFVFGRIAGLSSDGTPYSIFVLAALLPWTFFSTALSEASQSLIGNTNLISKVYFPRLIIPSSAVIVSFADFLISFVLLGGLLLWHGFMPDWRILTLPIFIALAFAAAMGPGLLLTALNVKYRDFRYVIPFIVQFGLYASPVGFSSNEVREKIGDVGFMIYSINPVVGVIDGFRWAICRGQTEIYLPGFYISLALTALFLWLGIRYFRKTEKTFADII